MSDFDGTMTQRDFYDLVRLRWPVPPNDDPWDHYVAGHITHFQALADIFARIRTDEPALLELVGRMGLDPALPAAVGRLRLRGWEVVVASAGCEWYIRHLLAGAGLVLEVHANPGRFVPGRGLQMEMPAGSPFLSPTLGVDKARIVRRHLEQGRTVAFAGDGFPDEEAALLVPGNLRFARNDLADVLSQKGEMFRAFDDWSQIARDLLSPRD